MKNEPHSVNESDSGTQIKPCCRGHVSLRILKYLEGCLCHESRSSGHHSLFAFVCLISAFSFLNVASLGLFFLAFKKAEGT